MPKKKAPRRPAPRPKPEHRKIEGKWEDVVREALKAWPPKAAVPAPTKRKRRRK